MRQVSEWQPTVKSLPKENTARKIYLKFYPSERLHIQTNFLFYRLNILRKLLNNWQEKIWFWRAQNNPELIFFPFFIFFKTLVFLSRNANQVRKIIPSQVMLLLAWLRDKNIICTPAVESIINWIFVIYTKSRLYLHRFHVLYRLLF